MSVITLRGFRPPPREDEVPWTQARIEEAPDSEGPWDDLEVQNLDPIDEDPAAPAARSFTTTLALLEDGWYRIVFLDAAGNSAPSDPVRGGGPSSLPLTASDLRSLSELIRVGWPAEPYDEQVELALQAARDDAVALVESLTCRVLSDSLGDVRLDRLAVRAVVLKAEALLQGGTRKGRKSALGRAGLRSISAGPWSESYSGPEEIAKAKALDPDPALHEVLWALATEECRESWLFLWTGGAAPASAMEEVNWFPEARGRGY